MVSADVSASFASSAVANSDSGTFSFPQPPSTRAAYRSYNGRISQCCIYSLFQLPFSSALLVIFVILICLIVHHIEQGVFILEIHHLRTVILQVHIEIAL